MPSGGLGSAGSAIQRKQAEDAPVADVAATTAPYRPTWEQVVAAAADDAEVRAALDIEWIDGLPSHILEQIDVAFSKSKEDAALAQVLKQDKRLRALERERATQMKALDARRKNSSGMSDEEYNEKKGDVERKYKQDVSDRRAELTMEHDAKRHSYRASKSVVKAPKGGVTWKEGRILSRVNFMAWGINLLGSAETFKAHFLSMERVSGFGSERYPLYLSAAAAARLQNVKRWFETKYPGYTVLNTTVGQSLRGMHQGSHPLGYQGHPLGIAIDFDATVNVHQTDGIGIFMLKEFGGTEGAPGRRNLDLGANSYAMVKQLGKDTEAGRDPSEAQQQFLRSSRIRVMPRRATARTRDRGPASGCRGCGSLELAG